MVDFLIKSFQINFELNFSQIINWWFKQRSERGDWLKKNVKKRRSRRNYSTLVAQRAEDFSSCTDIILSTIRSLFLFFSIYKQKISPRFCYKFQYSFDRDKKHCIMQNNLFLLFASGISKNFRWLCALEEFAVFFKDFAYFCLFKTGVAHLNRSRSPELLIYTTHFCFMMKTRKQIFAEIWSCFWAFKEKFWL